MSKRKNYFITMSEFQSLIKATHSLKSKKHAQSMADYIWKRLGRKYDFEWDTVDKPLHGIDNPRCISAIPKKEEDGNKN